MDEQRILGRLEEFQKNSEKRFDQIEKKLDTLNEFKWRLAGGVTVLSLLLTIIIEVLKEFARG